MRRQLPPALAPAAAPLDEVASDLMRQARRRLSNELAQLPGRSVSARAHLALHQAQRPTSPGALVVLLRAAQGEGDLETAQTLFIQLIERSHGVNRRWSARAIGMTPTLAGSDALLAREELHQELVLHLWQRLSATTEEAWELFFWRALDFAQRHVATAYLRQTGHWMRPGVQTSTRTLALALSHLQREEPGEAEQRALLPSPDDAMAQADLTDLRRLVLELPQRERVAVVLRYWYAATEAEIATALGGVTPRTVRNLLRRAYDRLRPAYEEGTPL